MPRDASHVSLWHPWQDRPGQRHIPVCWADIQGDSFTTIDELVQTVGQGQMYCFVNDILGQELPSVEELIQHKKTDSFISRHGKVVALECRSKRTRGFFIPASVWGFKQGPSKKLIQTVNATFRTFGYEALTPASLSEKVLRSTLPDRLSISRLSARLRQTLIRNNPGGDIRSVKIPTHFEEIYSYDEVKSYLTNARRVVSPFRAPMHLNRDACDYRDFLDVPASYCLVSGIAHYTGISPIKIVDEHGILREPFQGECFTAWLWSEEIVNCIKAGFTIDGIEEGYVWREMSDFMSHWSDILWDKFHMANNQELRDRIKDMMVGLPGRFLKSPYKFELIHLKDRRDGDEAVVGHWNETSSISTPWFIRATYELESAQLTAVGSYIVMRTRQKMYELIRKEIDLGNAFIRSYIDSASFTGPLRQVELLGNERGMFKQTVDYDVVAEENRLIPALFSRVKAPGFNHTERIKLHARYHS